MLQDLQCRLSLDMAAAAKAIRRSKVLTVHGTSEWRTACGASQRLWLWC
jgi:hypothetical protein